MTGAGPQPPPAVPAGPRSGRRLPPLPVAGLFQVGTRILRLHIRILLAVAIIIQLPGAILDAATQQRLADSVSPLLVGLDTDTPRVLMPTDAQSQSIFAALLLVGAAMLVSMILGAIATVAYAGVVALDYHGRPAPLAGILLVAFRRAFVAVASAILAAAAVVTVVVVTVALAVAVVMAVPSAAGEAGGLGVFLALVLGVGGAVLALTLLVRLSLATIAVAVEHIGPVTAIRRSWHLTDHNTWRTLVVLIILALVLSLLASLLVSLVGLTTSAIMGTRSGAADASDALIAAGVSVLLAPVTAVVQTVLYFDLRVRRDAWDLPDPAEAEVMATG